MYREERVRENLLTSVGSVEEWLKTLEIRVRVEELDDGNLSRCAQLLNKTNQMNLATRRLTEPELREWARDARHRLWTFRVVDKFGDSGLTGIASMEWDAEEGKVADFVLSCRVIGRKVEETMIYVLLSHAKRLGLRTLRAEYLPTAKNAPCLRFLESMGSAWREGNVFVWDVMNDYPLPSCISCELPGDFESA
jgi:FkbH-like protein